MRVSLTIPEKGKENKKVGMIPVSTTEAASCPDCPLAAAGCYAKSYPLKGRWDEVTNGQRGTDWATFTRQIAALPAGQAWRHNQAGDLPGNHNAIDAAALSSLVEANVGKRGFTYTHKPMTKANRKAVSDANARGFTVNLSANTLAHADKLASLAIAPVVVVLDAPEGTRADTKTPAGRTVITCPATYRADISCGGGNGKMACLICQKQRKAIVGFPAHGNQKKAAATIARATKG